MTKKTVKFTVEIECYEDTISDAVSLYTLLQLTGGISDKTPIERLGMQVARMYMKHTENHR